MIVIPVYNEKDKYLVNWCLKLKDVALIDKSSIKNDYLDTLKESDLLVNTIKYSDSIYSESRDINAPLEFIRGKSLLHQRKFFVTTRCDNSNEYIIYELNQPPKHINESLDSLYSLVLDDLRKEVPGKDDKGKYVYLNSIGFDKYLTDENLSKLQRIVKEENPLNWNQCFKRENISYLVDMVDFFKLFDCEVLYNTKISEKSMREVLNSFGTIKNGHYNYLNRFCGEKADSKSNFDILMRLSYINKLLYEKSLFFDDKRLIKKRDGVDKYDA